MTHAVHYQIGIPEALRGEAAQLYEEAFGRKFALAVPDREKRLHLLADSLSPRFGVATIANGKLAGLAGFQTPEGALSQGLTARRLFQHLGVWGGLRALLVFSFYERQARKSELLMDGIAVQKELRGQGVGTGLIHELKRFARQNGYKSIRLDVVDTNPGARRLYEREGFVPVHTEHFGYVRWLLGFGASTTMIFNIRDEP